MTASRLERLLPWACLASAGVLFASELMVLFELTPPGAEPLEEVLARDQHGNAMFVVAGFAMLLTIVAVWAGSRPAALGVAVMGVIALLIFLIIDLPDAGQVGTIDDARQSFIDAEAVPEAASGSRCWERSASPYRARRWRRCRRSNSNRCEASSSAAARRRPKAEAES